MKIINKIRGLSFLGVLICIATNMFAQKPGAIGRGLQNLTAHYNIYFNAKELLKESELNIRKSQITNFNKTLDIFITPTEDNASSETENLNAVIKRTNTISLEKNNSNWVDDAYILLAKAEYWKGNFYNASEYFSYVSITFSKKKDNVVYALIGQSLSAMALKNYNEADSVLKLATELNSKRHISFLNAAKASLALINDDKREAVDFLKTAVKETKDRYTIIRYTFIIAQLQEQIGEKEQSYKNYTTVVKSNASFEMAFNANLNRIRLRETESGKPFDKIANLKRLLREDKNQEFKDQIHYQIGNTYVAQGAVNEGINEYKISTKMVPGSALQKGLSFLKIAEINFDSLKNYATAKLYYDSTLQFLPKNYPSYASISKKATNLQYLAERRSIINEQDLLLSVSALPDFERNTRIDEIITERMKAQVIANAASVNNGIAMQMMDSSSETVNKNMQGSTFYFYNSTALSQGFDEFKRRWGNRKLADNWRVSDASGIQQIALADNNIDNPLATKSLDGYTNNQNQLNVDSLKLQFERSLPFTVDNKKLANQKILFALYELANFYKDVLNDEPEAIKTFEEILERYPQNIYASTILYQLYRLNTTNNNTKANAYKEELIAKYPSSEFARSLTNPNFGKEVEIEKSAINQFYQKTYLAYQEKNYAQVLQNVKEADELFKQEHLLSAKFAYLEALSVGYTKNVAFFTASLNDIVKTFPADSDVTPIVKSQLEYIDRNIIVFKNRAVALIPANGNETFMPVSMPVLATNVPKEKPVAEKPVTKPIVEKPATKPIKEMPKIAEVPKENVPEAKNATAVPANTMAVPEKPKPIKFENATKVKQAIIIHVKNDNVNLAKSISSLSSYFYSKFDPASIFIVLKNFSSTQKLIIVKGNFNSKDQALNVLTELNSYLPQLMNLPADKFSSHIISEQNLSLITSTDALEQYFQFNKQN